ncbi:hypothetical protein [Planomicrobium sp. YIM 101495]|uniref:hypothetical protein n=1 Tax=Planomicrobium sp. YIM 101495 TaxID=2665160 RepID=UPI0012B702E8|nr:hypothetical protein [Planomicrobium sp. YIM 101495]MTD31839.1 hypothetical protein [Planomicrobium sp. YIM 101495]
MENVIALEELEQNKDVGSEERKTQAQILVGLASDMLLFYDEQGSAYAKVKVKNHHEIWPIRSSDLKLILIGRYLELNEDKAPGGQAMSDALTALEAKARIHGEKSNVHVRIAETEDAIYLDLCNEEWQVVEIKKEGWQVVDESPVYFKRSRIMQPIAAPTKNGRVEDLKPFINFNDESDYKLIIAWLLSTFKEDSPFPILTIQGEQGSSKSTTTKVLRALIDPSSLPLRALPKDEKDLAIAANNTWILAFDNLSGLSNPMSDALAKLSTGGGLATRKLYSDDEESVFQIMRPAILNGIDDIGKRQDLLDRSIVINLPSIPESKRTDEKTFWKEFNSKKSDILGALCTIISGALARLPTTTLASKPRMADFALWITAAEKSLEWHPGEFMAIYNSNRDKAIDQGLESDPFATAVMELIKRNDEWIGNASQLLSEAARFADERTTRSNAWPTARSVRNRLRRINPALKKKSILYVEWENKMSKTLKLAIINDDKSKTSPLDYDEEKTSSLLKVSDTKANDDNDDNDDNSSLLLLEQEEDLVL